MDNLRLLNGNNLSYIGDAYYELYIRTYLINKGITKSNELKKESIKFVSASSHAKIYFKINHLFTEVEMEFFKKGRNNFSKAHRKNINIGEYAVSSGLEAVIGYLYLSKQNDRLEFIMNEIIKIVEEE